MNALNARITALEGDIEKRFPEFDAAIAQQVSDLKDHITQRLIPQDPPSVTLSYAVAAIKVPGDPPSFSSSQSRVAAAKSSLHDSRKFNLVVFGIEECPMGTHWTSRTCQDLQSVPPPFSPPSMSPSVNHQ